jgi:SHAQKYF class myb-like DNA-binding protein
MARPCWLMCCTVLPFGGPPRTGHRPPGALPARAPPARPAARRAGTAREKARGWSADEERLFLEALDAHGRDWKACAAHIGSRDVRAVTSHAQKHFIKLCLAGQRVPAKVAESGEGYTLSGKPLDPGSAAARSYGLKPELLARAPRCPRSPPFVWLFVYFHFF